MFPGDVNERVVVGYVELRIHVKLKCRFGIHCPKSRSNKTYFKLLPGLFVRIIDRINWNLSG
jgi:hypothetical protein